MFIDLVSDEDAELRPTATPEDVRADVRAIVQRVRTEGDDAIRDLTRRFDGLDIADLEVPRERMDEAMSAADPDLIAALSEAASRITEFARHQKLEDWRADIKGLVGESVEAVDIAGVYVPGGRAAYPSTVLMGALPARVAGVDEVIMCVPPGQDGRVKDPTLVAASLAGIDRVFSVGGAQAIAAMAYGTETIPKVDVVCGPGNIYVATAKAEVAGDVAIDSVAGPSEIAIIAGGEADPELIALDLMAQAEHGPGGSYWLITWDGSLIEATESAIGRRLDELPSQDSVGALLERLTKVLVRDIEHALDAAERIAPEHLELLYEGAEEDAWSVSKAGAVFAGKWSPVPAGDYIAGTNHILPTGGTARWASGLRTSLFQRTTTVVSYDEASLRDALVHLGHIARSEGLDFHAQAAEGRFPHDRDDD
jgi:histidinol dehydrogenase